MDELRHLGRGREALCLRAAAGALERAVGGKPRHYARL